MLIQRSYKLSQLHVCFFLKNILYITCLTCLCLVIDCSDPGTPSNGSRIGSVFTFGGSVRYRCNQGYKLSGNAIRTCGTSRKWSGHKAVCTGRRTRNKK